MEHDGSPAFRWQPMVKLVAVLNLFSLKQEAFCIKLCDAFNTTKIWHMHNACLLACRTWVMMATYGYSFGVELTMNNLLSQYMFDQFSLGLQTAGLLASVFGLTNILSRPSGGLLSDWVAGRWGMRGRLWALWITQTLAGGV
jgi:nitrate/nitrite transporter NarK